MPGVTAGVLLLSLLSLKKKKNLELNIEGTLLSSIEELPSEPK